MHFLTINWPNFVHCRAVISELKFCSKWAACCMIPLWQSTRKKWRYDFKPTIEMLVYHTSSYLLTSSLDCGKNWSGASAGPNTKKEMELAWTHIKKKWWQHHQTAATVDTTRPQRKRTNKEYFEKRFGERNVDSRIQVQLEEDGGGSTRQSWMETSGLWRKMEAAAQDRAGWRQVVCGLCSTGVTRHKSSKSSSFPCWNKNEKLATYWCP